MECRLVKQPADPPPPTLNPELLDSTLQAPDLRTTGLEHYAADRLDFGMTIGLARTAGGRLWACWVGGGDSEKAFFVLATSDDDGEHWSSPRLVIDPHRPDIPCGRRALCGTLWVDPLRRLWLFFDQALGYFDGRAGTWYARCDNPDAAQPAWSSPVRLWHGNTLNKPIVCSNGQWLLPVSLWDRDRIGRLFAGCYPELDPLRGAHVFASRDQGLSWQRGGMVAFPYAQFNEHHLIERADHSLWMTARTAMGIYQAFSADGGQSWTVPTPSPISQVSAPVNWNRWKRCSSRHHIQRLRSGRLLLIKHGRRIDAAPQQRSHLAAFVSDDDGHSWRGSLMLDERHEISYPDGVEAPDGTLYVSYDRNRATDGEILLARFTEQDILAGHCLSPQSRLQLPITRAQRRCARK